MTLLPSPLALVVTSALVPTRPWLLPTPRRVANVRAEIEGGDPAIDSTTIDVDAAAKAAATALAACEFAGWDDRALWALEDSVPRFSLEGGRLILWRRMSIEVPELVAFTPAELRARWLGKTAGSDAASKV